jgi:nucleoside-diphosphate-sugar epimerase
VNWLIIGCGYTGTHLANRLAAAGDPVIATRRGDFPPGLDGRVQRRRADLADPGTLAGWIPAGAVIVHAAPPADDDPGAGERALVAAAAAAGAARIVYVSSTGVYGPGDGGWVNEDTPVGPAAPRLIAETALLDAAAAAGVEAVALRASGIYGPGRGLVARMRAGTYRVVGGDTWVNRIHVHDLASAIIAAGTIAQLPRRIYTVADDHPVTGRDHAGAVAAALGLPPPPVVALADVDPRTAAMLGANRRIANRRLKQELGVTLRYPTFRESLAEELAAAPPAPPASRST